MSKKEEKKRIDEQAISTWMMTKFYRGLVKSLEGVQSTRKPGIHVTDLIYPCIRRAWYSHKFVDQNRLDLDSSIRIWIGEKLHETQLCEVFERELIYNGITCRIDEYDPVSGYFLDKKTTRGTDRYLDKPREHEITQAEYYRVMLERNGFKVNGAGILHINVDTTQITPAPVNIFTRSLEEIEAEMLTRKAMLETYLENDKLPPRDLSMSWLCRYCQWVSTCFSED